MNRIEFLAREEFRDLTTTATDCSISSMVSTSIIDKQRVTLFLHQKLLKQARAQAVVEDITLTTLVEIALVKYLPSETVIKKAVIGIDLKH